MTVEKENFLVSSSSFFSWHIRRTDGGRIQQEHTGQIFGFTSILVRFPRENSCIIVLSNLEETSVETVVDRLSDILFQENHDT